MTWTVEHAWHSPCDPKTCDRCGCMWCDGGLECCRVCGSFEGATTTHCPGEDMYAEKSDDVYAGLLDFRDGQWIEGCSRSSPAYWSTSAGLAEIEKARESG